MINAAIPLKLQQFCGREEHIFSVFAQPFLIGAETIPPGPANEVFPIKLKSISRAAWRPSIACSGPENPMAKSIKSASNNFSVPGTSKLTKSLQVNPTNLSQGSSDAIGRCIAAADNDNVSIFSGYGFEVYFVTMLVLLPSSEKLHSEL
uniref:Uncharacterized protein n=1 Tax=Romanomermis culicivorax TaxID=13658 RepID=A0A915JE23_ROMCU